MTSYVPPKKNSAYAFYTALVSQTNRPQFQTTPTLAAGDVKISKDGGALTNLGTLPSGTSAALVGVLLSAAEMNADNVAILFSDVAGAEWDDLLVCIQTAANTQDAIEDKIDNLDGDVADVFDDVGDVQAGVNNIQGRLPVALIGGRIDSSVGSMQTGTVTAAALAADADAQLADAVWDEVLTFATHNVAQSAGRRLRLLGTTLIEEGTATAGTANSITLAVGSSAIDRTYDGNLITITGGPGVGETRMIVEYDGATRQAFVERNWLTTPTAASEYQIVGFSGFLLSDHGVAQAGTANTITLAATATAVSGTYVGSTVVCSTGTAPGQARLITAYDGATKLATVSPAWTTIPDATTVYKVIPIGRAIVDSLAAAAVTEIADGVWAHDPRTLTSSAVATAAAVAGADITLYRGDTLSASITDLGNISTRTKLWFTIKTNTEHLDAAATVLIRETDGLIYLNGAAATAGQGSLVVNDQAAGDITVTLAAAASALLAPGDYDYDIQVLRPTGVSTLTKGTFTVTGDVTRATA